MHGKQLWTKAFGWLKSTSAVFPKDPPHTNRLPQQMSSPFASWIDEFHWLANKQSRQTRKQLQQEALNLQGCVTDHEVTVNGYKYYTKLDSCGMKVDCRRSLFFGQHGSEEIVVHRGKLAEQLGGCAALGELKISSDNRLAAILVDVNETDRRSLCVLDIQKTTPEKHAILWTCDDVSNMEFFGTDSHTLLVVRQDGLRRPNSLWIVSVGDQMDPDLLFMEHDERFFLDISKTKDEKFITINSNSKTSSEVRVLPADAKCYHLPSPLCSRGICTYFVEHAHGYFYIVTNDNGADNFKICRAPVLSPTYPFWDEVFVKSKNEVIEDAEMFASHLVLYLRDSEGLPAIKTMCFKTGKQEYIPLPEGTVGTLDQNPNPDFESNTVCFSVSTPLIPRIDVSYSLQNGVCSINNVTNVPDFDHDQYICRRVHVNCNDTFVPLTLGEPHDDKIFFMIALNSSLFLSFVLFDVVTVHRRDQSTSSPTVAIAYGAYGVNLDIGFNPTFIPLLKRGWVLAYCHTRGGGRKQHKQNSISDYLACLQWLCDEKISTPRQIIGRGTSAGAFVIAAACNEQPELFGGLVLHVPFVDVLTTMMDKSLPLTQHETDEWGDPTFDSDAFFNIKTICPYQNVKNQPYPQMLLTTTLQDNRVKYWQGLKYAAKIRTHTTNNSNIIVDIQDQGGHFTHTHSLNHAINEVSFSLQSLKRQIEKDFSVTSKEIEK
eukprot:gene2884-8159_t